MECCGVFQFQEDTSTERTYTSSFSFMTAISDAEKGMMEETITPSSSLNDLPESGKASPLTIVQPRRLSTAIVTDEGSLHDYTKGRSKVIIPPIENSLTETEHSSGPPARRKLSMSKKPSSIRRFSSAPIENEARKVLTVPPPLRLAGWSEPPPDSFKVRGPKYLKSSKKLPSDGSVFHLLTVDLIETEIPDMRGICSLPNERIQLALKREEQTGLRELPDYVFCVNLVMPGDPGYHLVSYFGLDDIEEIRTNKTPFGRVARRFFFGSSDKFRDETFKLIPRIVDGNFVVKKAVGTKPALLGTKVAQSYIRTERFCEVIVDIASDTVAEKIVKLTLGYVSVNDDYSPIFLQGLMYFLNCFFSFYTGPLSDC